MSDDRAGREIGGKYRLVRLLGKGGMGVVYEAQHTLIGRRFAIKFLHRRLVDSPSSLARFRREAQAAGSLESENIAAVTDFGTEDGAPYIVMEYLTGEDLSRLLARDGPMSASRLVDAVIQACRGLHAAHTAGIVHRDLKPANLFVTRRGDGSDLVKVLDFGVAKLRPTEGAGGATQTQTGATIGTSSYMAPEQARGEKDIDHRADVYALGVILYEALSGAKPHPGDSYNEILYHILSRPVIPLESLRTGLPAGLTGIVHKALAFDAKDRYASVVELTEALAPYAGRAVTPIEPRIAPEVAAAVSGDGVTVDTPPSVVREPSILEPEPLRREGVPLPASQNKNTRLLAGLILAALAIGTGLLLTSKRHRGDALPVASGTPVTEAPVVPPASDTPPTPAGVTPSAKPAAAPAPTLSQAAPAASARPSTVRKPRPASERRPAAVAAAPSSQLPAKKKPSLGELINERR